MSYKKIGFIVLLFMLIGELMIRFDEKFKLLEANRVVKIATSLTITPEFTMLENNRINKLGSNFRIMVIGDSYIHGGGIDFKDNFSQQLKLILKINNKKFDDIFVLDITKPSSNNLDNNQSYFEYADKYKPDIVIIGYNYNDVVGNLNKLNVQSKGDGFSKNNTSSEKQESITKKIYNVIYQSRFVHFVLSNLHTQLKSYGIVLPNSEFSLIMRSYPENKDNWVKSKILLQEIIDDS